MKYLGKIVLYGFSKGILSLRKLEELCKTNIIFMSLVYEATPDHSTIAHFISSMQNFE